MMGLLDKLFNKKNQSPKIEEIDSPLFHNHKGLDINIGYKKRLEYNGLEPPIPWPPPGGSGAGDLYKPSTDSKSKDIKN